MIVEYLGNQLFVNQEYINKYITTAPYRYKVYEISKRKGGKRSIAQPSKSLKNLQRITLKQFFNNLPIHNAAMAYQKGRNIKNNALVHVKSNYLLKMDFKNFFPSIKPNDFIKHIDKHAEQNFSDIDKYLISKLFFYYPPNTKELVLSIGAPSSPMISNTIMYEFDTKISKICSKKGVRYTRYADDLTFSTTQKGILSELPKIVQTVIGQCSYPNLKINHAKTVFSSRRRNMRVTGLVLSNDKKVSIGRSKKRYIRTLVYQYTLGKLETDKQNYLPGYLSFCYSVEPEFIRKLELKYGRDTISKIMSQSFNK